MKPLCFVVMPFGKKKDAKGISFNFDEIYRRLIKPAIDAAGMEPIRADEETVGGIIHKPMYERLILCDYCIADLSTANANVFYELGIRHTIKPYTTVTIFAAGQQLPFDVNGVRSYPYTKSLKKLAADIKAITQKLKAAKTTKNIDSPIYQLVGGVEFQNSVAHQKTDIFREQVEYSRKMKTLLENIRNRDVSDDKRIDELDKLVHNKIKIEDEEAGTLIDIMLTYRALGAIKKMIAFIEGLPAHVRNTVMVQEQLGFALNRDGRAEQAIAVLNEVIKTHGPSSETYGILGRVYKDKYDQAVKSNNKLVAKGFLDEAIETYLKGFEADWRDAFPGINVVTLLAIKGDKKKIEEIAPVVEFSVKQKIAQKTPDYWDYATLTEIAVIRDDKKAAMGYLARAVGYPTEGWMLRTTVNTMDLLTDAGKKRANHSTLSQQIANLLKKQKGYPKK